LLIETLAVTLGSLKRGEREERGCGESSERRYVLRGGDRNIFML
jgi:hypothetical protein